ncbi:hypothetical protein GGH94_004559 [Coemansia aciculifera]|uniref:DUF4211 domain-containing protein n=1 Tax=Coemansia aciculifera TaxID=417176 RepID=A0A9W8ILN1_9FUNG|nr:hypothetical protein GGH94_004559 [Coemansia aciculifera]
MARSGKSSATTAASVRRFPSDISDEWAPPDDELGLTLSQVLHRPSRKRPPPSEVKPKRTPTKVTRVTKLPKSDRTSNKAPRPPRQTTSRVLAAPVANELVALSDSDSDTKKEKTAVDAQHIAAISAMFDDSDNDDGVNTKGDMATGTDKEYGRDSQILVDSQLGTDDESNIHVKPEVTDQIPAPQMDFMDEESAKNYQRILENSKRERAERRRTFRAGGNRNNETSPVTAKSPLRTNPVLTTRGLPPLAKEPSTSADELPDDPLAERCRLSPHTTPSKRKRHAPLRICDSEASDDNEVLDERRILDQRLRTKPKLSLSTPSRFEQARLNMERETYASDSDNDDQHSIGAYDSGNGAGAVIDALDTDSEPEPLASNAVMVIRDSSDDDDDFISDPEDHRPIYPRVAGRSKESKKQLDSFISHFEPGRRKQMQQKLNRNSDHSGSRHHQSSTPPRVAPKAVKGYSQDLDDDIADFIVDDDDADVVADSEGPTDRTAGTNAYDSDISARPKFSLEGPRGVMALMPDEFSLFDLPTSFKAYVQYLVHWICNDHKKPVLTETNARYFFQAYIAVARVIDSVEQSVVASSAWVEPFRTSLHSYPDYAASSILGTPGCDACHFHSNRTATFCVTLSGTPYKRAILAPPQPGELTSEELGPEDEAESDKDDETGGTQNEVVMIDDDSDDLDSTEAPNSKSNDQPYVEYNLGKVCKMRSEICHELHHYFYHLAHIVEVRLETLDYEAIHPSMGGGSREDVSPDDLVEMLDAQGDIDHLFHQFKDRISRAKSSFTS